MKKSDCKRVAEIHYESTENPEKRKRNLQAYIDGMTEWFSDTKADCFVWDDGDVKGFLQFLPIEIEVHGKKTVVIEIIGLFVDKRIQRSGVGRKFVEFCEQETLKKGISQIVLWTYTHNTGARKFYEMMGFSPDGETRLEENMGAPELRYSKDLQLKLIHNR